MQDEAGISQHTGSAQTPHWAGKVDYSLATLCKLLHSAKRNAEKTSSPHRRKPCYCLQNGQYERIVKTTGLANDLRLYTAKGVLSVRKLGSALLFVLLMSASLFAAPAVVKSTVLPEPGLLVLLGSGLVGLATVIRRHLRD